MAIQQLLCRDQLTPPQKLREATNGGNAPTFLVRLVPNLGPHLTATVAPQESQQFSLARLREVRRQE